MAAAFTTSLIVVELMPNANYKEIMVTSPSTMIASDTVAVTLPDYGISISGFLGIIGLVHTTANSVIISDKPTTVVNASTGVLTITAPTRVPTTYKRVYRILGKSNS